MYRDRRPSRGRFFWGIVLLVFGTFALAVNLGLTNVRDWWEFWPGILLTLGVLQVAWPGTVRERLEGIWLIAVGAYCAIGVFKFFDLDWGTAWPIMVVAVGLRIVLGGIFRTDTSTLPGDPGKSGQGGVS